MCCVIQNYVTKNLIPNHILSLSSTKKGIGFLIEVENQTSNIYYVVGVG